MAQSALSRLSQVATLTITSRQAWMTSLRNRPVELGLLWMGISSALGHVRLTCAHTQEERRHDRDRAFPHRPDDARGALLLGHPHFLPLPRRSRSTGLRYASY